MTGSLMERITEEGNLYDAWRKVRANRGGPGADSVRLADFEERLPENLADLAVRLRTETYVPLPLRRATMPKRSGGERELAIPAVADRVAQRAFVNVLEPVFEQVFLPCSFGYRPGPCATVRGPRRAGSCPVPSATGRAGECRRRSRRCCATVRRGWTGCSTPTSRISSHPWTTRS